MRLQHLSHGFCITCFALLSLYIGSTEEYWGREDAARVIAQVSAC